MALLLPCSVAPTCALCSRASERRGLLLRLLAPTCQPTAASPAADQPLPLPCLPPCSPADAGGGASTLTPQEIEAMQANAAAGAEMSQAQQMALVQEQIAAALAAAPLAIPPDQLPQVRLGCLVRRAHVCVRVYERCFRLCVFWERC